MVPIKRSLNEGSIEMVWTEWHNSGKPGGQKNFLLLLGYHQQFRWVNSVFFCCFMITWFVKYESDIECSAGCRVQCENWNWRFFSKHQISWFLIRFPNLYSSFSILWLFKTSCYLCSLIDFHVSLKLIFCHLIYKYLMFLLKFFYNLINYINVDQSYQPPSFVYLVTKFFLLFEIWNLQ